VRHIERRSNLLFTPARVIAICMMLAMLALAGCTTYSYIPPTSDAGRQCVMTCATTREVCVSAAEQLAATQRQTCEARASSKLTNCLLAANNEAEKKACAGRREYCSDYANTGRCNADYDRCFVMCGGQIVEDR
jgi:hypothetical protein